MQTRHALHFRNDSVYPLANGSASNVVTPQRLQIAKWQACVEFKRRVTQKERTFTNFAARHYRCKRSQVKFDTAKSLRLIRNAVVSDECEDILGQTDGAQIEIMRVPMEHSEIVGVLLHEGMHNWCTVRGKYMSCANEHKCMATLGDPNES